VALSAYWGENPSCHLIPPPAAVCLGFLLKYTLLENLMAATAVGTFTATRSALNPLFCPSLPQKPDPFYISIPVFPTPNPPWNPL